MFLIDAVVDRLTMYRVVLYVLLGYVAYGAFLAYRGQLAFSPLALIASAAFLTIMCWAANTLLARIFHVPTNLESATLTALILALILDPPTTAGGLSTLGWAAILAMASKYILSWNNKHIFNPAAISAVIIGFALNAPASWWIGTAGMLPVVLIGSILVVRKVRQGGLVLAFVAAAILMEAAVSLVLRLSVASELRQLFVSSPLIFFATVMLTEPLTAPPTSRLKQLYGLLTGVLYAPQIHLGPIYSTPELALVIANIYSYAVSPKHRYALSLRRKLSLSPDTFEFAFARPEGFSFKPGQYMEWTLSHPKSDSRGNRRFFTLASSPTERSINVGVKFYETGSSFKRAMYSLTGRTPVLAGQVAGDFTLPDDPREKLVFIAGGIGITPFRSMLKYLIDTHQRRDIVVIYSNRTADDIVYRDVLREAQLKLGIPTIYTLTDTANVPRNWKGGVGRVDAELIARAIPDYRQRAFYLSGPPPMVRGFQRGLRSLHVPGSRIKTDFFAGLA